MFCKRSSRRESARPHKVKLSIEIYAYYKIVGSVLTVIYFQNSICAGIVDELAQNWRPDVIRCEVVPATGRELTQETTRNGETVTYELLDRKPPESMKRRIATPNLPYSGTWSYSLQPHVGGTIVRITENGEVYNPVFRFVSRFILGHAWAYGKHSSSPLS